jgi:hypothetical protein
MSITKKLASVFAGVVVAFVAFGMMASSASAISAQALMDMGLTAEQAAVVAALFAEEESSSCVAVDTTTTMGVQTAVNDLGYLPALTVDGVYGPATSAGVAYLQTMVGAAADGVFGPATRAAYNAYVAANCDDEEEMMEEEEEEESNSSLSGGETSLEDWNLSSEDDAQEGSEEHVATIEFDVEDADAMINRLDVSFDNSSVAGTADDEPWDVFETLTLMVDGDEIASEDIDDEDDWLDDDGAVTVYRLSGLDYVVEEGEQAEIEVYLTAQGNVDDAANANWIIFIDDEGLRALDSEGINSYFGDTLDTVAFGVEEEGGDESIEIKSSSDDPDAATLSVEDDADSDWYTVMEFRLEGEENDIDLEDLELTFTTGAANYEDVVNDIYLEIDGTEIDDVDVVDAGTTTADLTFDIDKDVTIDADDTIDVKVMVEFNQLTGNYLAGETVQVTVTAVSGEGVDDVSDTASLDSEEHTLSLAVAEITGVTYNQSSLANDDSAGSIGFQFTVDASDADEDVTFDVADNADVDGAADDILFTVTGGGTSTVLTALTLIDGDATYGGGTWTVLEGDEATFALDTSIDVTLGSGTYRVDLESVAGVTVDEITSGLLLAA